MKRISEIDPLVCATIRVVATDIDGTITHAGKITERTIRALRDLRDGGVKPLLITGRSAGFGLSLATYLPALNGLIAENGGVVIDSERILWARGRSPRLHQVFNSLRELFPHLEESSDNFTRLSDFTIDMRSVRDGDMSRIIDVVRERGLGATYSSVHLHVFDSDDSKGLALKKWLTEHQTPPSQVLTVGDSVNDESLFDHAYFPHSCWVGKEDGLHELRTEPSYTATEPEGAGFEEIVRVLLSSRSQCVD